MKTPNRISRGSIRRPSPESLMSWHNLTLTLALLLLLQSGRHGTTAKILCDDSQTLTFHDFNGTAQPCVWLAERPELIPDICTLVEEAREVCPETCGVCSDSCDDDDITYFNFNGILRNCEWLRLRIQLDSSLYKSVACVEGHGAWNICRETCENCNTTTVASRTNAAGMEKALGFDQSPTAPPLTAPPSTAVPLTSVPASDAPESLVPTPDYQWFDADETLVPDPANPTPPPMNTPPPTARPITSAPGPSGPGTVPPTPAATVTGAPSADFEWFDSESESPADSPTRRPTTRPVETAPPSEELFASSIPVQVPTVPTTKPPTKAPTDPPTREPTKPPTDPPTKAPTDPATREPTKPPTDPPTREPTKPPTDPPTKPPTKAPIDPPTREPTKPPTDPPTKPPTKAPTGTSAGPPTSRPTPPPTPEPTPRPTPQPTPEPTRQPTPPPTPNPTPQPTQEPLSPVFGRTFPPTPLPTREPTPNPTRRPTSAPTPNPTNAQTRPPTPSPTKEPTRGPTVPTVNPPKPSVAPSGRPTPSPTPEPTPRPTSRPTPEPTPEPTPQPSPEPTPVPVIQPTPTKAPTPFPSFAPVDFPTTKRPTAKPSAEPTPKPSILPTPGTTKIPTPGPTQMPSLVPSGTPTRTPTASPSLRPSSNPSDVPSDSPTITPRPTITVPPSASPSRSPAPTLSPTGAPSISPSDYLLVEQNLTRVDVSMELGRTLELDESATLAWQGITAKAIEREVRRVLGPGEVMTLKVKVTLTDQDPGFASPSSAPTGIPSESLAPSGALVNQESGEVGSRVYPHNLRRHLEEDAISVLNIQFNVEILLRSAQEDRNVNRFIGGAFNSLADQQDYIQSLRGSGEPCFARTITVSVKVPQENPEPFFPPPDDGSGGAGAGLITGLAAVIIVGTGLAAYFVCKRRKRVHSKGEQVVKEPNETNIMESDGDSPLEHEFIGMEDNDDISTLGDPLPAGMMQEAALIEGSSTIGDTISLPWDVQKAIRGSQSLDETYDSNSNIEVAKDDATLENQYETGDQFDVEAPSGMLGLVLESSNEDGMPVVHAIKDTSPLIDEVRVGDRLVSVDGEDVAYMLASDVSRMIAMKRDEPIRRFVFSRPPAVGVGNNVRELATLEEGAFDESTRETSSMVDVARESSPGAAFAIGSEADERFQEISVLGEASESRFTGEVDPGTANEMSTLGNESFA